MCKRINQSADLRALDLLCQPKPLGEIKFTTWASGSQSDHGIEPSLMMIPPNISSAWLSKPAVGCIE